jgi:hypothetical protein
MKNAKLILLCLLSLVASCESTRARDYLNAPTIIPAINANCGGYRDGEFVDATNFISVSAEDHDTLIDYVDDIETRLYICLKYKRKCK